MRTPFVWRRPSQPSLRVLSACCALWGTPAVAQDAPQGVPEQRHVEEQLHAPEQLRSPKQLRDSEQLRSPEQSPDPEQLHGPERTPAPPTPTAAPVGAPSMAAESEARVGDGLIDGRVLLLLATGCLVGLVAGRARAGSRDARVRLLTRPTKTQLPILVPPGPAPRLVPVDSPKATRALSPRAPVPRQTPAGATGSTFVDYIAAFADAPETSERARVDYLLLSDDTVEELTDPSSEPDGSRRQTG